MIKIAIVDDQKIFVGFMFNTISSLSDCRVIIQAKNGKDLLQQLDKDQLPDLVFLDISMTVMDGFETAEWLAKRYPEMKIIILTSLDSEDAMIRLINMGVRGFVRKEDISPSELGGAIHTVMTGEYFLPGGKLVHVLKNNAPILTPIEIHFLRLVCEGKTYREIATEMKVAKRTVDGYRDQLFTKLKVDNRTLLALYAVKAGIFRL